MFPTTAEQLNQLLDPKRWPLFETVETSKDTRESVVRLQAVVPANLEYFAGHFPEHAVLPGVVQVHWVGELSQYIFQQSGFSELKSIKFSSMVLPEQRFTLELKHSVQKRSVRFSYTDQDEKLSSGMLSFAQEPSATESNA